MLLVDSISSILEESVKHEIKLKFYSWNIPFEVVSFYNVRSEY